MTRVLWVTNIPTPYRVPLWEAIGAESSLHVVCMAESEPNRNWGLPSPDGIGFEVIHAPSIRVNRLDLTVYLPSWRLLRRLTAERWDGVIIDGWESPAYWFALLVGRLRGAKVVTSYRSTLASHRFDGGPVGWVRSWYFRLTTRVVTAGPASTAAAHAAGVPPEKVETGFNVVDVNRFHQAGQQYRHEPAAGHRFLYVGQLIERKNVAATIEAFARIAGPDDQLTVVGTGPLRAELEALAASLGVAAKVHFTGHLDGDDLLRQYAASDTFVLPSTEEVWGLVANEALAAGLHLVVTEPCGVVPSIEHMRGVFVSSTDAAGLADAMTQSRSDWAGPIADPEMLAHTPSAASGAFLDAIRVPVSSPA